jgi:hypothetical protein
MRTGHVEGLEFLAGAVLACGLVASIYLLGIGLAPYVYNH